MLPIRSFLFVPGDSARKMEKSLGVGADAIILDLEDAVGESQKAEARRMVADMLRSTPKGQRLTQIWVRINALDTALYEDDLAAIMPACPDGIVLPKTEGPADIEELSELLTEIEIELGIESGHMPILPVATETAIAPFNLGLYSEADLPRLYGLSWGAEDLSTALGGSSNKDENGDWTFTYKMVRSLTLLGARAAEVEPIETLYGNFRDEEGLRKMARAASREGFSGQLAIHPAQVAIINECFTPSKDEISFAKRVIEAFEASPGAGTVGLDGKMLDIPHLKQAEAILAKAKAYGGS